ncbi:serine peptidase [Streptomyces sp. NPDC005017]|uniref:serine peptidase n=1 Tax=Streptomyces sp. NPDC005017 TaxID=3364706 RepID=UPI0036CF9631
MGIHGIGNHRPGETAETASLRLSAIWARGLGVDPSAVEVVYYADLLRAPGRQSDDDDLDGLTDPEAELLSHVLESLPVASSRAVPQGRLTSLHRAYLADLAASWACSTRVMEWFMVRLVKEVAAYQAVGGARKAVQARLGAALERVRPDVVIAHSLGSVVAYETLHLAPRTTSVPLWVTLGSPLALPKAVFDRLSPAPVDGRGCRPAAVRRWANLADRGDLVALPPKGISRRFGGVESDEDCSIHIADFHQVTNYLKTRRLAALLDTVRAGRVNGDRHRHRDGDRHRDGASHG